MHEPSFNIDNEHASKTTDPLGGNVTAGREMSRKAWSDIAHMVNAANKWRRIRPAPLGFFLAHAFSDADRRIIVNTPFDILMYLDPLGHLARAFVRESDYEPQTRYTLSTILRPGDTFVDIGANEGLFSLFAAKFVGREGKVLSVEPQNALCDIIRINFALNRITNFRIEKSALGEKGATKTEFQLTSGFNCGGASLLRRYHWGRKIKVPVITFGELARKHEISHVRMIKIDTEGGEGLIVPDIIKYIHQGMIDYIFVDFHKEVIEPLGISITRLHREVLDAGAVCVSGDVMRGGYFLYRAPKCIS